MPKLIAKHLFFENAPRTASTSLYQIMLTIMNDPVDQKYNFSFSFNGELSFLQIKIYEILKTL